MPQKTQPNHPAHRKMTIPPQIPEHQKYDPNGHKTPSKRENPPEITPRQFGNSTRYQSGPQQLLRMSQGARATRAIKFGKTGWIRDNFGRGLLRAA